VGKRKAKGARSEGKKGAGNSTEVGIDFPAKGGGHEKSCGGGVPRINCEKKDVRGERFGLPDDKRRSST